MEKGWTRLELAVLLEKFQTKKDLVVYRDSLPGNFQQLMTKKADGEIGLTMSNIVWLGNQLETAVYSEPALKNWVKREIKVYIGAPQVGRKYSIEQAALLFIVKDLKVLLDFEEIRKVLGSIFNNPEDRTDDIISPVVFYKSYACLYENLMAQTEILSEEHIKEEVEAYLEKESLYTQAERSKISRSLLVAVLAVRTRYLKSLAKQYVNSLGGKE